MGRCGVAVLMLGCVTVTAVRKTEATFLLAPAAPAAVPCLTSLNHTSCRDLFGLNETGCCSLNDPHAVCCVTPLVGPIGPIVPGNEGINRSYCCPAGTECSVRGCTPKPQETGFGFPCGPTQGQNCNVSFLCSSGPTAASFNAKGDGRNVLVVGDSVSVGWTPVLQALFRANTTTAAIAVAHSPGALEDGGARSTSNFVQCFDYLFRTAELNNLPLQRGDNILMNFGLHDYNLGEAGVPEYAAEYANGLGRARRIADAFGAKITLLATTPCHNCADGDEDTVLALNVAAAKLAQSAGLAFLDLHTPIIERCGPVPWNDTGQNACDLCAPRCKTLSVHYTSVGYNWIAELIANDLINITNNS